MRTILLFAMMLFVAGCVTSGEPSSPAQGAGNGTGSSENLSCEEFCQAQPHTQCVGQWEISGVYPDCACSFVCQTETSHPAESADEPKEAEKPEVVKAPVLPPDDSVVPSSKTLSEMLDGNLASMRTFFYSEHDGSFQETKYTWKRNPAPDAVPGEIPIGVAPVTDIKFDGKTISSIQAAGFYVFENEGFDQVYGVAIFLDTSTPLDDYLAETFDIEFFPSVQHRNIGGCSLIGKDHSKNMGGEWVLTYFMECDEVSD